MLENREGVLVSPGAPGPGLGPSPTDADGHCIWIVFGHGCCPHCAITSGRNRFFFKILFIYLWLCQFFTAVCDLFFVVRGLLSSFGTQG